MPVGVAAVSTVIAASAFEQTIQNTLDDIVYQRSLLSFETRHMRVEDVPMDDGGTLQVLVIRVKSPAGEVAKRVPLSTVESVDIANEENHTFTIKSSALADKKGGVGSVTLRVESHQLLMKWVNGLRSLTGEPPVETTIKDFTSQSSTNINKPARHPSQGGDVHFVGHNELKPPEEREAWAPPAEPDMCWKFPLVLLLMTALTMCVLLVFSQLFDTGEVVVQKLIEASDYVNMAFGLVVLFALLLYMLDISFWTGAFGTLMRRLALAALAVSMTAFGLACFVKIPYMPLAIFILVLPVGALALRWSIMREASAYNVARVFGWSFLASSFLSLLLWCVWIGGGWETEHENNMWIENRERFAREVNCSLFDPKHTLKEEDGGIQVCMVTYLLYASPFIIFGVTLFFSIFLLILARYLSIATEQDEKQAALAIKSALGVVGLCLIGTYVASSVGGAGVKLASAAVAIFGVMMLGTIAVIGGAIGFDTLGAKLRGKAGGMHFSPFVVNFGQACLFFWGMFFFVGFLALSMLNQLFRRIFPCGLLKRFDTDEERRSLVTLRAQNSLKTLRTWKWTSVLLITDYLAIAAWSSKWLLLLIYIFFAWLITQLSLLPSPAVAVIFAFIGVGMFMIPVVPGPAVYLASGVLLTPILEAEWGGVSSIGASCNITALGAELEVEATYHFWVAALCACLMSYALKMVAHVAEQKFIGEPFRKSVKIRSMVGVNSRTMKAANYILKSKGINMGKVMLLCFGPDWPTSVLAGLLGANCWQCVLALSPMLLCTTPATLMGAFMTKTGTMYDTLFQVATLMTLMTQVGGMALMAQALQRVFTDHAAEIEAIPDDKEVADYEAKQARLGELTDKVKDFTKLPTAMRVLLVSGSVVGVLSYYGVHFLNSGKHAWLFQNFGMTDCLDHLGVPSEKFAIGVMGIKWPGLIALLMATYMMCTLFYFNHWMNKAAQGLLLEEESVKRSRAALPPASVGQLADAAADAIDAATATNTGAV